MEHKQKMWSEEEIQFLKENHEEMAFRDIAKHLNRTYSSIENKSHQLGLARKEKYTFNRSFFKRPLSEDSAYWFGFICADGYISGEMDIGIGLKKSDASHLKKFNSALQGNIPVTFRKRGERKIGTKILPPTEFAEIRIYSKEILQDLLNLGVIYRKSLTLEFPKFENEQLLWHFIRGFFDGDGSTYYDKRSKQLRAKFTCGSESFRKSLSEILVAYGIKNYTSGIDVGITGKESHSIFYNLLYDNAHIYLDRKFALYKQYKNKLLY